MTFQTWEEHGGSDVEKEFFKNIFTQNGSRSNQLLQLQRNISSVVEKNIGEEQRQNIINYFIEEVHQINTDLACHHHYRCGYLLEL